MSKKQKPQKSIRIIRTVVQHATISKSDITELRRVAKRYTNVKNYVYSRYAGINNLLTLNQYRSLIRDEWVKSDFPNQWKLSSRYWKLALDEAISNIKSLWSNTKRRVKKLIRKNERLTEDEKQYIYCVLKDDNFLYAILTRTTFVNPKKIETLNIRDKYINSLICRYIRKCKSIPKSNNETSFMVDSGLYKYVFDGGKLFIRISSSVKGKRLMIEVKGRNVFTGNIRVKLRGDRVEFHHCVKTRQKQLLKKNTVIGLDKGYKTLIATSSNNFYGEHLNDLLSKETERLNNVNQKRNRIWVQMEKLKKEGQIKKADRIFKNNFGRKKYDKNKFSHDATTKSFINHSLNQFFFSELPIGIVQEDLSFSSWKNAFPKHIKRKLSRWIKGYIKKRIEFKCDLLNIEHTFINAAYTSQVCHKCHAFGKREGDVFTCLKCGKTHADTNAAKNIKSRKADKEITLYTPFKEVKKILEKRVAIELE